MTELQIRSRLRSNTLTKEEAAVELVAVEWRIAFMTTYRSPSQEQRTQDEVVVTSLRGLADRLALVAG